MPDEIDLAERLEDLAQDYELPPDLRDRAKRRARQRQSHRRAVAGIAAFVLVGTGALTIASLLEGDESSTPVHAGPDETRPSPSATPMPTITMDDVRVVDAPVELIKGNLVLLPPSPDDTITVDLQLIADQIDEIPEDVAGIEPEVIFGLYLRGFDDTAAPRPTVALLFTGVTSRPVGPGPLPPGAEPQVGPVPGPAFVVALYDASTGHPLGVWIQGCDPGDTLCRPFTS